MAKQVYDPSKVSVSVNGVPVTGWADGDFVVATFETDTISTHIGTSGEGRFIKSLDASGTITIRVMDYSDANIGLSAVDTVGVPVIVAVTDKTSNGTVFFSEGCMVQKIPDLQYGNEAKVNEWVFRFIRGTIVHAGAADI